jgi:hypothetical protein
MESNEDSSKPTPFGQVWLVALGADAADRSFYKIVRPDRWYSRLGLVVSNCLRHKERSNMRTSAMFKGAFYLLIAITLFVGSASAQNTSFRSVQLAYGISIEIPSHWKVLSQETRQNLRAAHEAMTKNADIEDLSRETQSLLAVNATPDPASSIIRVSVTTPPEYTQADLVAATAAELNQMRLELSDMFKKYEAYGGPKILGMQTPRVEQINNQLALVMSYTRTDLISPSPWQVAQYKIPASNKLIEITLSYRQSDAVVWKLILENIKHSIRF